jgi:hypothetical protein
MKRIMVVSALAIIALLSFACKKDGVKQALANAIAAEEGAVASGPQNYGYVVRLNASFCTLASDDTGSETDKVKWAASMPLGDRVTVGETRKLTYESDGTVYDFIKVRRDDGSDGFAFAAQVAAGGQLAVVVDEKANLFKSPKAVDVTGTLVSPKTVVVYYPETESGGFVEIKGYDYAIRQGGYVRLSSLSRKNSDIQSSIMLQTAVPLGNTGAEKIKKDALLEMALLEYPDSAFYTEILTLVNPNAASVIQTEPVPASRSYMIVIDNNVNVRSVPDTVAGRVIDSLNEGVEVRVTEQTVAESVIDGERAHWYHLSVPVDGWIFGAFLDSQ